MPDKHGYPTNKELKELGKMTWVILGKQKPVSFNGEHIQDILDYLEDIWWCSERQMKYYKRKGKIYLQLHTGGWSGNEEIINLLHGTMFWHLWWIKTIRGGHYYFEIEALKEKKNVQKDD